MKEGIKEYAVNVAQGGAGNTPSDAAKQGSRPQSLPAIFKETHNLKVLFRRMGMHDDEILKSLL